MSFARLGWWLIGLACVYPIASLQRPPIIRRRMARRADPQKFIKHRGDPTRTCASLQHPSIIRGLMARRADPQVHPTRTCTSLQHPAIIRRLIARRANPQHEFCQLNSPHGTYLLRVTQGSRHLTPSCAQRPTRSQALCQSPSALR